MIKEDRINDRKSLEYFIGAGKNRNKGMEGMEEMKGKWKVSGNVIVDEKTYNVYRQINVKGIDHSGNREVYKEVFKTKAEAQAMADKLNEAGLKALE